MILHPGTAQPAVQMHGLNYRLVNATNARQVSLVTMLSRHVETAIHPVCPAMDPQQGTV